MNAPRGRPRKMRPVPGSYEIRPGMSQRDLAIACDMSRHEVALYIAMANVPKDEFERLVESGEPEAIYSVARRRAGKATEYTRRCPHCGVPLRIEDAR